MKLAHYQKTISQGLVLALFIVSSIGLGAGIKYAEIKASTPNNAKQSSAVAGIDDTNQAEIDQSELQVDTVDNMIEEINFEQASDTTNNASDELVVDNVIATPAPVPIEEQSLITPYNLDVLVDKNHPLPNDFIPNDLERISSAGIDVDLKDFQLRGIALTALKNMNEAMQKDIQKKFMILSSYRSFSSQSALYNKLQKSLGGKVDERAAVPGYSEHQLGTAVDLGLRNSKGGKTTIYGSKPTTEWRWLDQNAHKYGFVMSYRFGQKEQTGYKFEPWHWRYVGVELAKQIRFSTSSPADSYLPINT